MKAPIGMINPIAIDQKSASNETSKALEEVAKSVQTQAEMAEKLNTMVSRFKI